MKADETRGGLVGAAIAGGLIGAGEGGRAAPFPSFFPENSGSPYLDVGDNVHANVTTWLTSNCATNEGLWFIPGTCENGHRIAKVIVCGKEWCPKCGEKGSMAHNRRYVRWLPKVQQFKRMRYLVFTIPEGIRPAFRTKESLTRLGRQVQELLKRQGFPRGLRRWHWFGDRSHKWHPHLNVLVEGGYMNGATLQAIKKGYAAILGVDVVSVRTSYKPTAGDMASSLFYVTRATFRDYEWDLEMALELRNFRNMVVWGKGLWNDPPAWELNQVKARMDKETGEALDVEAINKIANHECHICGSHISWGTALPGRISETLDYESLGAGYYHILDRNRGPDRQCDHTFDEFHKRHRKYAQYWLYEQAKKAADDDLWHDILVKAYQRDRQ